MGLEKIARFGKSEALAKWMDACGAKFVPEMKAQKLTSIKGLQYKPLTNDTVQLHTSLNSCKSSNTLNVHKPTGFKFGVPKKRNFFMENIPYNRPGADVTLTYREGAESLEFSPDLLKGIKGYTDSNGNILPYILLDDLTILNKGNGLGKVVMEDIKQIARDKCGGRLLLIPSYSSRNPSPFYYKCGLRSTTQEGRNEILAYLNNGTPFKSGSSSPMYLPIEHVG